MIARDITRECFLLERRSRQCEAPSPREGHSVYCARGTAGAHHHRTVVLENTHLWGLIPPDGCGLPVLTTRWPSACMAHPLWVSSRGTPALE